MRKILKHPLLLINLVIVVLCLAFQIVHFGEHTYQTSVWLAGEREKPQMTALGMWAMHEVGMMFFPDEPFLRQSKLGLEVLHLVGNGIFLIGIIALYSFIRVKSVLWAMIIEGFHLYEHVSLTVSALALNKSIGMSTLFGLPIGGLEQVALRVWWHFIFNAIPTALVVIAIYGAYSRYKKSRQGQLESAR